MARPCGAPRLRLSTAVTCFCPVTVYTSVLGVAIAQATYDTRIRHLSYISRSGLK
jgi:hypothetical protein